MAAVVCAVATSWSCFADWTVPPTDGGCSCAPAVPADWSGPVTLLVGAPSDPEEPPSLACSDPATEVFRGGEALTAGAPSCECSCQVENATCPTAVVDLVSFTSAACFSGVACQTFGQEVSARTCAQFTTTEACGHLWGVRQILTEGTGACAPTDAPSIPPAEWAPVIACDPQTESRGCAEGQRCMPAPPSGAATCIHAPGELDCPEGPYAVRRVEHASVSDDRSCSACSCSLDGAIDCNGTVTAYVDEMCNQSIQVLTAPSTDCVDLEVDTLTIYLKYQAEPSGGTCAQSGGLVQGAATAEEPRTFCCLP